MYLDSPVVVPPKPKSKLMVAIDVVRRYMQRFQYGLFDGSIYKKAPEAKFTFVYCCSIHDFIHHILGNADVANAVAHFSAQIIGLLKVKTCRLIPPIVIDFNFIEVLPFGTCFDIFKKTFVKNPKTLKGEFFK